MLYQAVMYQILNVITPPDNYDFLTLDEMRTLLGVADTDHANDERLSMLITEMSVSIAKMVNRVLAKQKVNETFYEMNNQRRLYFSQWPVKLDDIETLALNGEDILPNTDNLWVLEEETGTLYMPDGAWFGKLEAIYSGGYLCPDEVPEDLKNACAVVSRESYYTYLRGVLATGVRMLSHKSARIQFMQPTAGQGGGRAVGGVSPSTWSSVQALLDHYYRHWI